MIRGSIVIDPDKKTVTIELNTGSYCRDHYTQGVKRFLDEEIEYFLLDKQKEVNKQWKM